MSTPVRTLVVLGYMAAAFAAGYLLPRRGGVTPAAAAHAETPLYYACPMHPAFRSERAGTAPCCGMRLEPVYARSAAEPAAQAAIGVQVGVAERGAFSHAMRYPGRVSIDETRVYRWNAAVDGWIRDVSSAASGSLVTKGEPLAAFYAPDFLGAQQAFIYTSSALDRFQATGRETPAQIQSTRASLQQAVDALKNLGMSDAQVEELGRTREISERIRIVSPVTGFLVARNVSPGQRFDKGTELYRFADLAHVWVMADVFEKDRELIRAGAAATIRYQGRAWTARMSNALPQFDASTRTLKTRFELDNPGLILRPDMFVDVEVQMKLAPAVHIPVEALLDTGARRVVYVETAPGAYQARPVETGWRLGDRVQVTRGLAAGDRIVVSGNFLIDSEARMKAAASNSQPPSPATARDPICGMAVDASTAHKLEIHGTTHYFCSEACKTSFAERRSRAS